MAEGLSHSGELRGSSEVVPWGQGGPTHPCCFCSRGRLLSWDVFAEATRGSRAWWSHPREQTGHFALPRLLFLAQTTVVSSATSGSVFTVCVCVSEQSRSVLLQRELRHHCSPSPPPGLGLAGAAVPPRAATDLLGCPEPLGLGLSRVNTSGQDVLCQERPSSAWLRWEFSG